MKQYSHDYTKVTDAESHLYAAQQLNAHDDPIEAWKHIEDARRLLQEYLAQDNMVPDDDIYDGWCKASEVEAELDASRRQVRHYQETQRAMNAVSREIVRRSEEVSRENDELRAKVVRHGQIDRQYNQQLEGVGNPDCPFYDKDVRITGTFDQIGMSRDEVAAACQRLGAKSAREGICKSMDIVIIGNNPGPTKQKKIETWRKEGHDITTISQFDFKEILNKYGEGGQHIW